MITAVTPRLNLIFDGAHDGLFNMALDESLFRDHIQKKGADSILRFYRFSEPTLTVGYGMWRAVNLSPGGQNQAIRRLTGGGIVSHTREDLTYSLIVPISAHSALGKVKDSYYFIHDLLRGTFQSLNLDAELYQKCDADCEYEKISYCFDSPVLHDIMLAGKKIAGAGQKRSQGHLLQQGSIAWQEVLRLSPDLDEHEFCERFANATASAFNLSVTEVE